MKHEVVNQLIGSLPLQRGTHPSKNRHKPVGVIMGDTSFEKRISGYGPRELGYGKPTLPVLSHRFKAPSKGRLERRHRRLTYSAAYYRLLERGIRVSRGAGMPRFGIENYQKGYRPVSAVDGILTDSVCSNRAQSSRGRERGHRELAYPPDYYRPLHMLGLPCLGVDMPKQGLTDNVGRGEVRPSGKPGRQPRRHRRARRITDGYLSATISPKRQRGVQLHRERTRWRFFWFLRG